VRSNDMSGAVAVDKKGVAFATLALPTAKMTGMQVSWTDAAATLTAAGAAAFSDMYAAGESLDPVTIVLPLGDKVECGEVEEPGTGGETPGTGGETPGTGGENPGTELPETGGEPAAAASISGTLVQGGELQVSASGFDANERIRAVAHSTPTEVGVFRADADGKVAFSWKIPTDFEAGDHTLYLTGLSSDVVVEVPFTVEAAEQCVARSVSGATFEWSVRESFRSYVEGPIAKGSYSINWGTGSGAYNTDENRGRVSFGGSAQFDGHNGLLDLSLSNPRIQVHSATSATLYLNVRSTDTSGDPAVNANGVAFATLSLPAASVSGDRISWSGASATLTAAGAEAFGGFYAAGEALDPVSFTFPLGAEVDCDVSTSGELAATGGSGAPVDVMWVGMGMLLLGAAFVAARRRTQRA
jgi:hypothetical protein